MTTTPPAEAVDAAMAVLLCKRAPAFNRCAVHEFKTWDGGWTDQGCPVAVSVAAAVVAALHLPERDREAAAKAWDRGYSAGHSNAMRRMSDEPNAPTSRNPYAEHDPAALGRASALREGRES